MRAVSRLSGRASTSALSAKGCSQFWNVNCCHTALKRPLGSLKLNATITKIGRNRYNSEKPAATFTAVRPTRPAGDVTVPLCWLIVAPSRQVLGPEYPGVHHHDHHHDGHEHERECGRDRIVRLVQELVLHDGSDHRVVHAAEVV